MKKIMFNDRFGLTQAVLDGRKTQTRWMINPQPKYSPHVGISWKGGAYGINSYVGEPLGSYRNFVSGTEYKKSCKRYRKGEIVAVAQSYKDIGFSDTEPAIHNELRAGWKNKMFVRADLMPHKIRITNVRVERLQDISDENCLKEGIKKEWDFYDEKYIYVFPIPNLSSEYVHDNPREAFAHLIDKVTGKGTWEANPYVFVYDFELIRQGKQ